MPNPSLLRMDFKLNFLFSDWSFRCFFCYIDEEPAPLVAPIGYLVEPVIQFSGGHYAQKPFQHVAVIFGASKIPVPSNPQQEDTQDIQFAGKNQFVLVAFYEQKLAGPDFLIDQDGHALVEPGKLLKSGRLDFPL